MRSEQHTCREFGALRLLCILLYISLASRRSPDNHKAEYPQAKLLKYSTSSKPKTSFKHSTTSKHSATSKHNYHTSSTMSSSTIAQLGQYLEREVHLTDFMTPEDSRRDSAVVIASTQSQPDEQLLLYVEPPKYTPSKSTSPTSERHVTWASDLPKVSDVLPAFHNHEHKPSFWKAGSKAGTAGTVRLHNKKTLVNQSMNAVIGRINGLLIEIGIKPIKTTRDEELLFERGRYMQHISNTIWEEVDYEA